MTPVVFTPQAQASEIVPLYTVAVDVESEKGSERRQLTPGALESVFIRISGRADVVQAWPGLSSYLRNASSYLSSYRYRTVTRTAIPGDTESAIIDGSGTDAGTPPAAGAGEETVEQLQLVLQFQKTAVDRLLRETGVPRWQARRPGVLVWLVVQDGATRQLANAESAPGLFGLMEARAGLRGLPLIQPLLDLEEQLRISPGDIWSGNFNSIQSASSHYDASGILVGKLSRTYSKGWLGEWRFLLDGELQTQRQNGGSLQQFTATGIDLAADVMARKYAIAPVAGDEATVLWLSISGIETARSYAAVSDYVNGVSALQNLRLVYTEGDTLHFNFESAAGLDNLAAVLELNKAMQVDNTGSSDLNYRWAGK